MNWETWEPAYEAILAAFGYDRAGDEAARDDLAELVPHRDPPLPDAGGATVAVAGAGPSLPDETGRAGSADLVFAASTAADTLREAGVTVDVMVTDLDKNPRTAVEFTRGGTPVAVHAHGDNRDLVATHAPDCDPASVVPTTQAAPRDGVWNFGGFTDGDRAAFLADHLGAASLQFVGWDLTDQSVGGPKAEKLRWAARLLGWLERRRGERFEPLDGLRGSLTLPWGQGND
jgi:uncharacterized Rossmann fold enzyme